MVARLGTELLGRLSVESSVITKYEKDNFKEVFKCLEKFASKYEITEKTEVIKNYHE